MATSVLSSCFSTVFRFTVDISNLTSNYVESTEIKLSDVNWKIKVCKQSTDGCENNKDVLAIYLVSSVEEPKVKWSCEAQAAFKLLHKDDQNDKSFVKYLIKQKYSDTGLVHGFDNFIDWNDFLEHFAKDDAAVFEIEITTNPLYRKFESDVNQIYSKFCVKIENVSRLQSCSSSEVVVRGIKWKLVIKNEDGDLSVFLWGDKNDMGTNWTYKVDVTFLLLSFNEEVEPMKRTTTHKFRWELYDWGYATFLKWSDFIDKSKRYVYNDAANFVVEFKVDEPTPLWGIGGYKVSKATSLLQCCVCLDCFSSGNIFSTKCGHLYCQKCFKAAMECRQVCSMCKAPTSSDQLHPIYFA